MGKKISIQKTSVFLIFLGMMWIGNPVLTKGQDFSVSATPDSTLMVIGGQMNLTLEVAQPPNINIVFPQFTDTITKNIEIVDTKGPDTTQIDQNRILIKKVFRITSFDSGLHYIPPMEFELASAELAGKKKTRSIGLMVANPFENVDPQKGITDIKAPRETPFILAELLRFLPWILGGLVIALLIAAGIWFYIKRKNPLKGLIKEKPKDPPHVVALRELDHIKSEKLWQKGQVKEFYSELTDVLREYLEERYNIPAPEQITSEIMQSLKTVDLPDEKVKDKIQQVLELADLVKFAKMDPLPDENDLSLMNSYFFVNQTKYEEQKSTEQQAKELKEREENQPVEQ
ncbi:hypothetical protein [Marinilabilia rubra]|uniref:hypothetical protein n=1 Tax=Marinilabilia rubra TaxID=2162893 RepID=UPI001E5720B1|nr:hypothetical protein [Marinilabilia rubra]